MPVAGSGFGATPWTGGSVEDPFAEFDEEQVDDDHGGYRGEEGGR
jgi:hypothetical protein